MLIEKESWAFVERLPRFAGELVRSVAHIAAAHIADCHLLVESVG